MVRLTPKPIALGLAVLFYGLAAFGMCLADSGFSEHVRPQFELGVLLCLVGAAVGGSFQNIVSTPDPPTLKCEAVTTVVPADKKLVAVITCDGDLSADDIETIRAEVRKHYGRHYEGS